MGRRLSYSFSKLSKEQYLHKIKLSQQLLQEHQEHFPCERNECKEADRFVNERDHCDFQFQRCDHDLPYSEIFTKESMKTMLDKFYQRKKYYEVSVLAIILDQFSNPTDQICIFNYD